MHDIWNPWHGCVKCSEGCRNCYMYFLDKQRGVRLPSSYVHKTGNFNYPLKKSRKTGEYKVQSGERIRVNMTSDTFLDIADDWRDEMWEIIKKRSDVIFWLLTKRPERMMDHLPDDWGDGYDNVVLNITCENQEMFDRRYKYLVEVPAKHKGMCLAPLIGDIDISPILEEIQLDDVSTGGENYGHPRPCKYEWVAHIAETCRKYRTNFCWFETGTNFWKDGKQYFMPDKHLQSQQAYFAGLNQRYRDIYYDLRYEDGSPVKTQHERVYNIYHCMFCSNQDLCNGCGKCGNCTMCETVSREALLFLQQSLLRKR